MKKKNLSSKASAIPTKTSILSSRTFKEIIQQTLKLFSKVWWRIISLNFFSIVAIGIGAAILLGIAYGVSDFVGIPFLEVLFENKVTDAENALFKTLFSVLLVLFGLVLIIFSSLGKISTICMIKRVESTKKQKATTLLKIYFREAPLFFWRFIMNGLRIFWYVIWPVLIIAVASGILFFGASFFLNDLPVIQGINTASAVVGVLGGITAICFLIRRSISVLFAQNILLIKDISSKEAFQKSLIITKGRFWSLFSFYFGIIFIGIILFAVPSFLIEISPLSEEISMTAIQIIDVLQRIFWAPFVLSFYYLLTNFLLKKSK